MKMKDTWGREISVDTQAYENAHNKAPRGIGAWTFHLGGFQYGAPLNPDITIINANYASAKKRAMLEAKIKGRSLVVVHP